MIAHQMQRGQAGNGITARKVIHHAAGILALIHVIAQMDQHGGSHRPAAQIIGNLRVQIAQLRQRAMNIANGVNAPPARQMPRCAAYFHHFRSALGSSASRSPSPTKLKASTTTKIANPGMMESQGACVKKR